MVEYKVRLQGDDGKDYVITFADLLQRLKAQMPFGERIGWNGVTTRLRDDVDKIEECVRKEILTPKLKQAIISFLKEHPDTETRVLNNQAYSLPSLERNAWYYAKEELEEEGKIVSTSQGRGKNRLWIFALELGFLY